MFIELTDHLRCPADHTESYLVLIPDQMDGRRVVRGALGCPVCRAEYRIAEGVVEFGVAVGTNDPPGRSAGPPADAAGMQALLGLEGPGGYVGLVGSAAGYAADLVPLLRGVHLVAVNPPTGLARLPEVSIVRAPRMPFKARSLRGVVLGTPEALVAEWRAGSIAALLPGLRGVGEGPTPEIDGFEVLGTAEGWWVGRKR